MGAPELIATVRGMIKGLMALSILVVCVITGGMAFGLLDIAFSVRDDRLGMASILRSDSSRALASEP
jgi:hypothetical protein